jgi:predicted TIM-barrel fold metal-dependent hydrolase
MEPSTGHQNRGREVTMLQPNRRRLSAICNCCPAPFAATEVSRRSFLGGAAAVAATAAASSLVPPAALAQAKPYRIDVHHHIAPPSWLNAMDIIGRTNPPLARWSVQRTLEDMDKGGVATAITSPTAPQVVTLGLPVAIKIARESNEFAKKVESDHKGRFGTFAMLPMPHIDATLKEIEYAFDTLKVDGVGILTNYGDKWLGYSYFDPVWAELNRRKATVYTHPADANCCVNLVQHVPSSAIEWGTDTTRSIANLIFSGSAQKFPDINWIFSNGGGALTSFSERFLLQMPSNPPYRGKINREQVQALLNRFHYDTAQVANSVALGALAKLVPVSQIVYGTDFPYRTAADHAKGLAAFFGPDDLKKVDRDNALRLLPRWRDI